LWRYIGTVRKRRGTFWSKFGKTFASSRIERIAIDGLEIIEFKMICNMHTFVTYIVHGVIGVQCFRGIPLFFSPLWCMFCLFPLFGFSFAWDVWNDAIKTLDTAGVMRPKVDRSLR
jgi:hypothetical protein